MTYDSNGPHLACQQTRGIPSTENNQRMQSQPANVMTEHAHAMASAAALRFRVNLSTRTRSTRMGIECAMAGPRQQDHWQAPAVGSKQRALRELSPPYWRIRPWLRPSGIECFVSHAIMMMRRYGYSMSRPDEEKRGGACRELEVAYARPAPGNGVRATANTRSNRCLLSPSCSEAAWRACRLHSAGRRLLRSKAGPRSQNRGTSEAGVPLLVTSVGRNLVRLVVIVKVGRIQGVGDAWPPRRRYFSSPQALPVNNAEKGMRLYVARSASHAAQALGDVLHQQLQDDVLELQGLEKHRRRYRQGQGRGRG